MNELVNYAYEGNNITFQMNGGDVMVNLTQMAKPFGKLPAHFLSNEQTKEFIIALEEKTVIGIPITEIKQGGVNQGTWAHQKLALKFAAWLNPRFELWVYDRIEELLRHGFTAMPATLDEMIANPDLLIGLATKLKEERLLRTQAEKEIKQLRPKAELMDKVLDVGEKIDIGQAAKILGLPFGRNTLFEELRKRGVFFKNRNEPKQQHIDSGYFLLREQFIERNNHDGFVVIKVLVTQKGLSFLNTLFANAIPNKQTAKVA
jgi:phage antirepressor YoqD-like protein